MLSLTPGFRLGVVMVSLAASVVAERLVLAWLPGTGSGRSEGDCSYENVVKVTVLALQQENQTINILNIQQLAYVKQHSTGE